MIDTAPLTSWAATYGLAKLSTEAAQYDESQPEPAILRMLLKEEEEEEDVDQEQFADISSDQNKE